MNVKFLNDYSPYVMGLILRLLVSTLTIQKELKGGALHKKTSHILTLQKHNHLRLPPTPLLNPNFHLFQKIKHKKKKTIISLINFITQKKKKQQ